MPIFGGHPVCKLTEHLCSIYTVHTNEVLNEVLVKVPN